jgi:hypothetical protein
MFKYNPKYPIYIISKGRAESRLTSKTLDELNVPYRIVIEESEYDDYNKGIPDKKILTLPKDFRENPLYARPDVGGRMGGSIPARNWVFEHSISEGHDRHWIMDDNIRHFYRLNRNRKIKVADGTIIRCCEDFVDRYTNIAMAGMNYDYFCPTTSRKRPYTPNTRIYSCILLDNSIKHRWRGKYNEDTDLSLRILKDGYPTVLFNCFLCGKAGTLSMKGGNTEDVYKHNQQNDNRLEFAESLMESHPDVVHVGERWGRNHHYVDYAPFRYNKMILKDDIDINPGINEYGMKLIKISAEQRKEHTRSFGDGKKPYLNK